MQLKLIHKLLIAMFACAALVLVLNALVTRASIGRGFMDFLHLQERSQVELVVPVLARWYGEHGNWDRLSENPREFYTLVFNAIINMYVDQLNTSATTVLSYFTCKSTKINE